MVLRELVGVSVLWADSRFGPIVIDIPDMSALENDGTVAVVVIRRDNWATSPNGLTVVFNGFEAARTVCGVLDGEASV